MKSSIFAWLCAMIVVLGLAENRAWGFFEQPQPAPGVFTTSSPEAIGENYDASRYDAPGCAVAPRTPGKTHGHHSDPKFMGGDPKQKLTTMPEEQHKQLHRDLNDYLVNQTDEFGNHMRPQRGNSGARIRDNFSDDQRRDAMADFYRQYESTYPDAAKDFFDQHPDRR